ncbi:hypothetical protein LL252_03065 [Alcanivorax marinus]|uniref:Thioesterase n=1 Tax=Alloalcanivorax marinus TaxID=1177169 RepID=A0A9Q3UID5_9GAMM|nr:hypothetical protein [Alloalcanivorax marinus]MCC4307542.1 hypothetical protein [Alloalcanivorax marinus]
MNPGSKPDGVWRTPHAYPFQLSLTPHYSHLDTERHVNNVAVHSFHLEARTRFLMARLDRPVWYADDLLLRPRRTLTQFLGETHYPHPVIAAAVALHAGEHGAHLRTALFQNEECVGIQDCLLGAWQGDQWVPLPEPVRAALAGDQGAADWPPELPLDAGAFAGYPERVPLVSRYADLDPDRVLSELALARYAEQGRAGSLSVLRQPQLGLLVARIDLRFGRWDRGMGEVALATGLSRIGNTSFVLRGGITVDGVATGTAESVMVLIDRDSHRPTPVAPYADAMAAIRID